MLTIIITEASPDRPDISRLIADLDAYYAHTYPPHCIHVLEVAELVQPDIYFLVAEVDGRAVGCGGFLRDHGVAELKRMYVNPAYRGQGIATRILSALEAQIRREGFTYIRLESGDRQPEALSLYAKFGYQFIPPFIEYLNDPHSVFLGKAVGRD